MKIANWLQMGIHDLMRGAKDYTLLSDVWFESDDKYSYFIWYPGDEKPSYFTFREGNDTVYSWYLDSIYNPFGTCPDTNQPWEVMEDGETDRLDGQEY